MSTNYATAKYQEIYDVNTVSNNVSVIGIHTPVGSKPRQMLAGFFTQFRKYKYRGCSVVATPAQRLGLNLAQISVSAGSSAVNPKDVFNPILVRGCHGDNLNAALNSIYKGSFENSGSSVDMDDHAINVVPSGSLTWEQMYYRMLQDPSFKKFNMSSGLKLSKLHPMIYNVASNHQIMPNQSSSQVGVVNRGSNDSNIMGFDTATYTEIANGEGTANTQADIQFMTNRLQSLGWIDTRQVINSVGGNNAPGYTVLPKIFMAAIILPPAMSQTIVTSMRFVVTHYFEFKEFNTSLTLEGASEYYDWLTVVDENKSVKTNDTLDVKDGDVSLISDGTF